MVDNINTFTPNFFSYEPSYQIIFIAQSIKDKILYNQDSRIK